MEKLEEEVRLALPDWQVELVEAISPGVAVEFEFAISDDFGGNGPPMSSGGA